MTGYGHRGKPKAGFPRLPTALGNRWRDSHIPTAAKRRAMEKWKAQKRAFPLSHGTTGYGSLNSKSKRRPGGGASLPLQAHRSIRKCWMRARRVWKRGGGIRVLLPRSQPLRDYLACRLGQGLGLGHRLHGLGYFRVGLRKDAVALVFVKSPDIHLFGKISPDPIGVAREFRLSEVVVVLQQVVVQLTDRVCIRHPPGFQFGRVRREVGAGEGEKPIAEQLRFQPIHGWRLVNLVRCDSAAAVNRAAAVGHFHVLRIARGFVSMVVVIVEGFMAVVDRKSVV